MLELSAEEAGILALSLRVAIVSVVCSLPFAILVAYGLARSSFPGKTLVDAIVHLPLVLPPVVVGFALLVLFGKRGPIGSVLDQWFGVVFAFRWTGAALASALMGFPLMVRAIRLSIEGIDRRLETAARRASRYERLTAWESPTGSFVCIRVSATLSLLRASAICRSSAVLRACSG